MISARPPVILTAERSPLELVDLLDDPGRAAEVPLERIPAFMAQLAAAVVALAARLAEEAVAQAPPVGQPSAERDGWLTVAEAAGIAKLKPRWFYRHWHQIPGAKKLSRKCLRFQASGFQRWLEKRP